MALEPIQLNKLLQMTDAQHNKFMAQAQKGIDYYNNKTDVLISGAAAIDEVNSYLLKLGKNPLKSADNRIPTNWHKILTDQKIGYLFSYPPQFDTENSDNDKKLLKSISDTLGGEYERVIKQLGVDASNTGCAWLTYWYNKAEPFEYYFIDPLQVRVVYDTSSIKPKMLYLIRSYVVKDNNSNDITKYEVWTDKDVTYYDKGDKSDMTVSKYVKHTYGTIPFICFKNNATMTSDLAMYKQLIDCIDKLVSGFANDIDDLQEIIWVIKNYAGETSNTDYDKDGNETTKDISLLQKLKAEKFITVDENGGVETLKGEIPYEARSKFLEILTEQLFISAMAVNPNPDKVGQASGVYIDFLYSLLELKSGMMETEFRPSFDKFIQAILKYLNKTAEIEQKWTRNKPQNNVEIVSMINNTPNTVLSDETKTKEHPLVENWSVERERIKKEQAELAKSMFEQDATDITIDEKVDTGGAE